MDNQEEMLYLIVMITNVSGVDLDMNSWDSIRSSMTSTDDLEKWLEGQTYEPVAIYTNLEDADFWAEKLTEQIKGTADEYLVHFDILGMEVDQDPPQLLTDLIDEEKLLKNKIEEILIKLMKKGFVEQLIGEDGRFYYEITDSGREMYENLPPDIKEYFEGKEDE